MYTRDISVQSAIVRCPPRDLRVSSLQLAPYSCREVSAKEAMAGAAGRVLSRREAVVKIVPTVNWPSGAADV